MFTECSQIEEIQKSGFPLAYVGDVVGAEGSLNVH
jgi:aconitase B